MVRNDSLALAAVATGAAAVATCGIYYNSRKSDGNAPSTKTTVLIFKDCGNDCGESDSSSFSPNAITFKCDSSTSGLLHAMKSAVVSDLEDGASVDGVRLFVQSTGMEIKDGADDAAIMGLLKEDSKSNGLSVPVLTFTLEGAALSKKAAESKLQKFPWPSNTIELPFGYGHLLAFTKGKRELPHFNGYDNLLRENQSTIKTVRIRRFPYKKDDVLNQKYYSVDYKPHEDEGLIVTVDPDMIGEMLHRQEDFPKMWTSAQERRVLEFVESGGLFTDSTTSPEWKTAHAILPKYFNALRIQNYYPIILEKTQAFVKEWTKLAVSRNGRNVIPDVADWFACMTADAVVKSSMDYDMRNVERKGAGEDLHRFLVAFRGAFGYLSKGKTLDNGPEASNYRKHKQVCKEVVDEITQATRNGEIGGPLSFVTGMLETKASSTGDYIKMKDFWGHATNIMVAGHETTAATLGFCLAEMSKHPECMEKAVKEIESVMGDRSTPTYDDIGKLPYIDALFREALRLYPAVQALKRECANDTIVLGKYLLRKGQRIETLQYGLHRDAEQWDQGVFGSPEEFNPERHMPGAPSRHPYAMNPFGFGVRGCIGMQFALLEAKVFLCMMLNYFEIKTPPNFEVIPARDDSTAPTCKNLTLIIKPRPSGPLSRVDLFEETAPSISMADHAAGSAEEKVTSKDSGKSVTFPDNADRAGDAVQAQ